ncbi:putative zinc protease [Erysiphe necator]|nr:putative zinc protease [Erysiphe necator]
MPTLIPQFSVPNQGPRSVERVTNFLKTNSLDKRLYRLIKLQNKLEVVLIHDNETDKASACMDVRAGYYCDDEDMPGMAHAVEHLLFMGTKKYPEENAYSQYINNHSGQSNAWTMSQSTHYFFDVAAEKSTNASDDEPSPFYGALDRFAQFFCEPLFLSSTVDRELLAVDSEHKKNLQNDAWRSRKIESLLSNPKHPFSKFSTGNLEVLKILPEARGVNVRQKFIEFYEKHYSANRMKLTVLGKEPLDTLEEWVANFFSSIPNKDLERNAWEEPLFRKEDLLIECFIKPIKDFNHIYLQFPAINTELLYETCPENYLSYLFDHQGPGSLTSYLKNKGWVIKIEAGGQRVCPGTPDLFNCWLNLTEDGIHNYREIIKIIFQYISLLNETEPQKWIHDEQNEIGQMLFNYNEKWPAIKYTSLMSQILQTPVPREWLISNRYIVQKFDPDIIKTYLSFLRPDNFRIILTTQKFDGKWDRKEKWYGAEYTFKNISDSFLSEIKTAYNSTAKERLPELHMPQKNQFIPKNLNVEIKSIKEVSLSPKIICENDLLRVWHKKDDQFWVPKGSVIIYFRSLITHATPETYLKSLIYAHLVEDTLEDYSYDAANAGLHYTIKIISGGIQVSIAGYNDKLSSLLEKLLLTMKNLKVKQERFEVIMERMIRDYKNRAFSEPYLRIGKYVSALNVEKSYLDEELLLILPFITSKDIEIFFPQIFAQMHIEMFVHGNFYKEDALIISDMVERTLKPRPLSKSCWEIYRSTFYPPGCSYLYPITSKDPDNINNCIAYQLFIGDANIRTLGSKTLLLDQIIKEPVFNQLRTNEQLGYIVSSDPFVGVNTISFRFTVQSEKTTSFLESRIESFLSSFAKTLQNMPETEFEENKRSLITILSKKLETLNEEMKRMHYHIFSERYDFELAKKEVAEIKILTKSAMIDYYQHFIDPASQSRSKIVVCINSQLTNDKISVISKRENCKEKIPASSLDNRSQTKEDHELETLSHSKDNNLPYIITDIHEFKSRLPCTTGPLPVKPLSEYIDKESKL